VTKTLLLLLGLAYPACATPRAPNPAPAQNEPAAHQLSADELLEIGKAYNANGRSEQARQALLDCLARDPQRAEAYYQLGLAQSRLEQTAEARDSFRRAHELDPSSVDAAVAYGVLLDLAGENEAAQKVYRDTLARAPANRLLLHELGNSLLLSGRKEEGLEALERAAEKGADVDLLGDLGYARLVCGKTAPAFEALQRAFEQDSSRTDIGLNLARAALALKDHASAVMALEKVTRQTPSDAEAWLLLALARLRDGQARAALEAAEKALSLAPSARGYFLAGMCQEALGKPDLARPAVEKALQLDPKLEDARRWLERQGGKKKRGK